MKTKFLFLDIVAFDNEGEGQQQPPAGDPPPPAGGGEGQPNLRKYTQEHYNHFQKTVKEEFRKKAEGLQTKLEELQNRAGTTEAEKERLQEQIETLKASYMSEAEMLKTNNAKAQKDYEKALAAANSERDQWRNRYTSESITRSLMDAAVAGQAYNPQQIVGLLTNKTRLVEEIDGEGKPTGNYTSKVKFSTRSKDGQQVDLEITPQEALKLMKEDPENYGNLFKSNGAGGIGGTHVSGGKRSSGALPLDTAQYMEARKTTPLS